MFPCIVKCLLHNLIQFITKCKAGNGNSRMSNFDLSLFLKIHLTFVFLHNFDARKFIHGFD
jgi:hypothetical protein